MVNYNSFGIIGSIINIINILNQIEIGFLSKVGLYPSDNLHIYIYVLMCLK